MKTSKRSKMLIKSYHMKKLFPVILCIVLLLPGISFAQKREKINGIIVPVPDTIIPIPQLEQNDDAVQDDEGRTRPKFAFNVEPVETRMLSDTELVYIVNSSDARLDKGILNYGASYDHYSYIEVRLPDLKWYEFQIPYDLDHVEAYWTPLDSDRILDLVVKGDQSYYGSGGGTTEFGTMLLKIDSSSVTKIFDFWYGGAEENFGRSSDGYYYYCGQEVEAHYGEMKIAPASSEKDKVYDSNVKSDCPEDIKPGIYHFKDGKFQWEQPYPIKKIKKRKKK
jgi:hypothetical protein